MKIAGFSTVKTGRIWLFTRGEHDCFGAIFPVVRKHFRVNVVRGLRRRKAGYEGPERYVGEVWSDLTALQALRIATDRLKPVEPWLSMNLDDLSFETLCSIEKFARWARIFL